MIFDDIKGPIHYELEGTSGPVIVLLNGIMMSTNSWEPFVADFTEMTRLLRVDFYDQGTSASLEEAYTQDVQVDMLERLLAHLNLDDVHIAGISYGASIAMQYAVKYPARLLTLMLFNGVMKTSLWLKDIGRGWNEVAKTGNGLAYYHITIPYIYSDHFYIRENAWMNARKKVLVEVFSDDTFLARQIRLTNSAETHDVSAGLQTVKVPTLVVASDQDVLTPPHEQAAIAEVMPLATLITLKNCGHASMYEQPDMFTSLILGHVLNAHTPYTL